MTLTAEKIREVTSTLQGEVDLDELHTRMHFIAEIEAGLAQANAGMLIDQDEIERESEQWVK